jgi:enamine deaminase RidA (YjgF/YER057c/UK114 family)
MTPSERLRELGIELPAVAKPIGSYVPAIRAGNEVFTSGQLPMREGALMCAGKVGAEVSLEQASEVARQCAINALAAAAGACGGVDKIARIIHCRVYVNSAAGFADQPKVANGASDFLAEVFGDAGKHARAAVGVSELPINAPVELELLAEVR